VVHEGENACFIPTEVWSNRGQRDRIGYVVVRLNETNTEATVLGFVSEVSVEHLPLSYLRSLDDLIDRVCRRNPLDLGEWANKNVVFAGWQAIDNIRTWAQSNRPNSNLAFSSSRGRTSEFRGSAPQELIKILQTEQNQEKLWKAAEALWEIEPKNPAGGGRRLMDISVQLANNSVSLMVATLTKPDQTTAVLIRVYPTGETSHLPEGIELSISDEDGNAVGLIDGQAIKSGAQDEYIQRKFISEPGTQFVVSLVLGESVLEEYFLI
jgi:hypothetical protein